MNKFFLLAFFLFPVWVGAQNLVPNPSFEDTMHCPTYADDIEDAMDWTSCRASPDYFNSCASTSAWIVGVPINFAGHQAALEGNAYAGIVTHTSNEFPYSYREIIGIQLTTPLLTGQKYYVSAFFSRADTFGYDCATNKMGFRFSKHFYSILDPVPIDNFSHIHSDSIILNKDAWTRIMGSFIADSAYQYLMIGNFYDEAHTDTAIGNHPGEYAGYYYVDAVCVSTDSLYCLNWTGIEPTKQLVTLTIYPNPANDFILIKKVDNNKMSYILTNTLDQIVKNGLLNSDITKIETYTFPDGIYFLSINNINFNKKIIIHH